MAPLQAAAEPADYPPQPWRLVGALDVSVWLIRGRELEFTPPPGWRPLRLMGRCIVGGAWARYDPGGDLAYRELAVGVAVRRGLRVAVTLPWIWVDDARSLHGGRALWAIPKAMARFAEQGGRIEAGDEAGRPLAALTRRRGLSLPGRWPVGFTLVQAAAEGARLTPARVTAKLEALSGAGWSAGGPLAFLDGRRPLFSLRLERAALRFGRAGRF
jgi:hypothetical protein